nr:mucin-5AC-like isoform X10 [Danio rerio]|eukprot:XP_021327721.1 mucin-5AC-like isoform X10 [Danio rerio]
MSAVRALLLLIFGFTMLKFICCYSDGSLLNDQCQSMAIDHGSQASGQDSNPFTVVPDNVTVDISKVGMSITVTLSTSSGTFMGYMLEARECENCPPAGTFSLLDSANSLLLCGDKAVTHPNNLDKSSVQVTWMSQATGQFFFRAAFIKNYSSFWTKKAIMLLTTTTSQTTMSPPTTTQTTTQTTQRTTQTKMPTTTQTTTKTPTTLQMMTTATTTTDTTVTTRRTTLDTSTAPPTSAVNSTQTGLTVFTTPNLQATVNTTQTDPTTNTTVITTSDIQSQTTVNTTQTDPTTNTKVITTSNTRSQTTGK